MALTLDVEQRLEDVGLITFFDQNRAAWKGLAKRTYDFLKADCPAGSTIRQDDVAKVLKPFIEVDEDLRDKLHEFKLTQKYWISYFTDLIIDRLGTRSQKRNRERSLPNEKKG
jgi:hypothetical protein